MKQETKIDYPHVASGLVIAAAFIGLMALIFSTQVRADATHCNITFGDFWSDDDFYSNLNEDFVDGVQEGVNFEIVAKLRCTVQKALDLGYYADALFVKVLMPKTSTVTDAEYSSPVSTNTVVPHNSVFLGNCVDETGWNRHYRCNFDISIYGSSVDNNCIDTTPFVVTVSTERSVGTTDPPDFNTRLPLSSETFTFYFEDDERNTDKGNC